MKFLIILIIIISGIYFYIEWNDKKKEKNKHKIYFEYCESFGFKEYKQKLHCLGLNKNIFLNLSKINYNLKRIKNEYTSYSYYYSNLYSNKKITYDHLLGDNYLLEKDYDSYQKIQREELFEKDFGSSLMMDELITVSKVEDKIEFRLKDNYLNLFSYGNFSFNQINEISKRCDEYTSYCPVKLYFKFLKCEENLDERSECIINDDRLFYITGIKFKKRDFHDFLNYQFKDKNECLTTKTKKHYHKMNLDDLKIILGDKFIESNLNHIECHENYYTELMKQNKILKDIKYMYPFIFNDYSDVLRELKIN